MKVFLHEYVTGGGFFQQPMTRPLAGEGLAMIAPMAAAFSELPDTEVLITLDPRIPKTIFPGVRILPVDSSFEEAFQQAVDWADSALIVAPETGGVLFDLTARVERAGLTNLGCSSEAVKRFGDKYETYLAFRKLGISQPETSRYPLSGSSGEILKNHPLPFVIKPVDGIASEGVFYIENRSHLEYGIRELRETRLYSQFLVQEFVRGEHKSATLIGGPGGQLLVSINSQLIPDVQNRNGSSRGNPSGEPFRIEYQGSRISSDTDCSEGIQTLAENLHRQFPGLLGFWGMDFVLRGTEVIPIEVNPRLTTSFFGISSLLSVNCATLLLDHAIRGSSSPFQLTGSISFSKSDLVGRFFS